MKQVVLFLLILFFVLGCSPESANQKALAEIAGIIEEHPDSAYQRLGLIDKKLIKEGEEKALYNLLLTESLFKLYKPVNDSLINNSIEYYEQSGDSRHLATSYYYKGVVVGDLDRKEEATLFLKKAEELALNLDDELLRNKIYDNLDAINLASQNYPLALDYAKRFLESSVALADTELICRAYDDLANIYSRQDNTDSAILYRNKWRNLISESMMADPFLLANYADDLLSQDSLESAKELLEQAAEYHPQANQYVMLGKIAHAEGDTASARKHWEKAITFNDTRFTIKAYRKLAYMAYEQKAYQRAVWLLAMADSINESYHEQLRTSQLTEIQQKYDAAVERQTAAERESRWLRLLMVALLAFTGVTIYHLWRVRVYKNDVASKARAIGEAQQKIAFLESSGEVYEQEVNALNAQIEQMKNAAREQLSLGKLVYERVEQREWLKNFSTKDEDAFIDYYAFTYADRFVDITSQHPKLTRRQTTYLVMLSMGLDDKDIAHVLGVKGSTIRSYRHRFW